MKYSTLLFDSDDTILDFKKAEAQALELTFDKHGLPFCDETLAYYSEINACVWREFELGKLTKQQVLRERFNRLFNSLSLGSVDVDLFSQDYPDYLSEGHFVLDGMRELIQTLCNKYKLYIITNGVSWIQKKRLKDSDMNKYFINVFISDDLGVGKPDIRYFDYVLSTIEEKDKSKILVIGDSPTSDIKGGNNAGLDTCYFKRKESSFQVSSTYTVKTVDEMKSLLLSE